MSNMNIDPANKTVPDPKAKAGSVPGNNDDSESFLRIDANLIEVSFPSVNNTDAPECLIMKDSWPLVARATTGGDMFKSVKGRFGVPEVIDSYAVTGGNPVCQDSTKEMLWDEVEGYNIWKTSSDPKMKEDRVHMRILIKTRGRPLKDAKSPKELVQGVLHAMLGELF